jgi:hypothetical protein
MVEYSATFLKNASVFLSKKINFYSCRKVELLFPFEEFFAGLAENF